MNIIAIIIARGGSKGLPNKNIISFCGKPLIAWTIETCLKGGIKSVWVSSDSEKILKISEKYGASTIKRPSQYASDHSNSESAWIHAVEYLRKELKIKIDWVIAPQVTSPLTEAKDVSKGILKIKTENHDSYFSSCVVEDLLFWKYKDGQKLRSINYDWQKRERRQDVKKQFIENGAFYAFKPELLIKNQNRFGENIGNIEMDKWKIFEIDNLEDMKICEVLMKNMIIK